MKKVITLYLLLFLTSGGLIYTTSVSIGNPEVRATTSYTIEFQLSTATPTTAVVTLSFPSGITVPTLESYSCTLARDDNIATSGTCSSSNNLVTINNFFSGGAIVENSFTSFSVSLSGITNPIATTLANFLISITTLTSGNSIIDTTDVSDTSISIT